MNRKVHAARGPGAAAGTWPRRLAGLVLISLVAALVWFWQPLSAAARADAAYAARIVCSCRYIAERSVSDCRKDLQESRFPVILSDNEESRRVNASLLPLSSQSATFRTGSGCILEPAGR